MFAPVAVIVTVLGTLGAYDSTGALAPGFGFPYQLETEPVWVRAVSAVLGVLGLVASVVVIIRSIADRAWTLTQVGGVLARRSLPLLLWSVAAVMLVGLGLLLLIVPGLYLLVVFGGALGGVVIIERRGLRRTFALVHPVFLAVLGRLALLGVLQLLGTLAAFVIAAAPTVGAYPGDFVIAVSQLLFNLLTIPIVIYSIVALTLLYAQLRAHEDPTVDISTLDRELDQATRSS